MYGATPASPPRQSSTALRWSAVLLVIGAALTATSLPRRPTGSTLEAATNEIEDESRSNSTCVGCPNVVMITFDDVGYNDLGYMSSDIPFATPNLDAMALGGVRLTNYYGQSLCTPARTTLMSGKFVHRTGFSTLQAAIEIMSASNYSIPLANKILPQYMQDVGYSTYVLGKWNIGHCNHDYLPWNRGVDGFLGYLTAGVNYLTHVSTEHNYTFDGVSHRLYDMLDGTSVDNWQTATNHFGSYTTHMFTSRAVYWLEEHTTNAFLDGMENSKPLFMWLAYHAAHDDDNAHPPSSAEEEYDLSESEDLGHKRSMTAKVLMDLDNSIGSFVDTLNTTGILENTVIIVNSDNGGEPCGGSLVGSNYPLRGSKMTYFEGGIKVPAFLYAPGILPQSVRGTTYDGLMHHVDWLATIYEGMVGSSLDDENSDSINHWGVFMGDSSFQNPRSYIIFSLDSQYAIVRKGDMKLMRNVYNSSWYGDAKESVNSLWCVQNDQFETFSFLFNISDDPLEKKNLYYEPTYQTIITDFDTWLSEKFADEYFTPNLPYESFQTRQLNKAFNESGGYIVPWGCSTQ